MINLGISYNEIKAQILAGKTVWIHYQITFTEGVDDEAVTYTQEYWAQVLSIGTQDDGEVTVYMVIVNDGNVIKMFGATDPDADLTDDNSGSGGGNGLGPK